MKPPNRFACLGVGLLLVGAATMLVQAQTTGSNTAGAIGGAHHLVNKCANIREGDLVWIVGGTHDQKLLEDIAVEVRKLGAHPLLSFGSDRLTRNIVTDVPARFDTQEPKFELELAEMVDAVIKVDHSQQPDLLADIPAKRLTDMEAAFEKVWKKMLERGVVQVSLGNGLYPTIARAKQFGISERQLSEIFWNAINVDYDRLQGTADRVKSILASGREVRITGPRGTDLEFEIENRPVFQSDGVVSQEDRYAGGPATQVWLPAGEVYVTPVPGTANGTFVAENFFFEGEWIEDLKLTFKNGKLTRMTAKGDITALKERFDAAPAGKDVFALVDIGVNPKVKMQPGSRFVSWMGAGTISVGCGDNQWAGGENEVPYGLFAHLTNGTMIIDGRKLVDRGQLVMTR